MIHVWKYQSHLLVIFYGMVVSYLITYDISGIIFKMSLIFAVIY